MTVTADSLSVEYTVLDRKFAPQVVAEGTALLLRENSMRLDSGIDAHSGRLSNEQESWKLYKRSCTASIVKDRQFHKRFIQREAQRRIHRSTDNQESGHAMDELEALYGKHKD